MLHAPESDMEPSILSPTQRTLLKALLTETLAYPTGANQARFQAEHDDDFDEINNLVARGWIEKRVDRYVLRPLAIAELADSHPEAVRLLDLASRVIKSLRAAYKEAASKGDAERKLLVSEVEERTQLSHSDVLLALTHIADSGILASYSTDLAQPNSRVVLGGGVLRYKTFDDVIAEHRRWASGTMSEDPRKGVAVSESEPPRVFVSYSHDTPAHKQWVAELSARLRHDGIDVALDQWDLRLGADAVKFMERGVRDASRVLMICTENYVARVDKGMGGAGYEGMVVSGQLIRDMGTEKFIPLMRQERGKSLLPTALSTRRYVDFCDDAGFEQAYEELLTELHGVAAASKPPLGTSPFKGVSSQTRLAEPAAKATASPARSRVRVPREFSEQEKDQFLEDAYESIAKCFEKELVALERDNSHVQTRFRRIDARQFSAAVYRNGKAVGRCRVRLVVDRRGGGEIRYSYGDLDDSGSYNESLSVDSDGHELLLRPMGLGFGRGGGRERLLTSEAAAELYWAMLVDQLRE